MCTAYLFVLLTSVPKQTNTEQSAHLFGLYIPPQWVWSLDTNHKDGVPRGTHYHEVSVLHGGGTIKVVIQRVREC